MGDSASFSIVEPVSRIEEMFSLNGVRMISVILNDQVAVGRAGSIVLEKHRSLISAANGKMDAKLVRCCGYYPIESKCSVDRSLVGRPRGRARGISDDVGFVVTVQLNCSCGKSDLDFFSRKEVSISST